MPMCMPSSTSISAAVRPPRSSAGLIILVIGVALYRLVDPRRKKLKSRLPMVTRPHLLPGLPKWSRKTLFALALFGICFCVFAFPVLWLILTSRCDRKSGRFITFIAATEFTLHSFRPRC